MTWTRRGALAGIGLGGVGLLSACARMVGVPAGEAERLASSAFAARPGPAPATPSASPALSGPSPSPSPFVSPSPSAGAGAAASESALGTVVASPSASPVASRAMPVPTATPEPSAAASASPSASASAAAGASAAPAATAAPGAYASGASCIGAADGQFGTWRGKPVQVAATWAGDGATHSIDPGAEYGSWTGHLDFAPQYSFGDQFTWGALASGAYDGRLRTDLQNLRSVWGSRPGTLYYRFQHEFNGNWYRWSVDEGSTSAAVTGGQRMARIFRSVMGSDPRFKLAWSPAAGNGPFKFRDIRSAWPGAAHVDVIAVDFYDFAKPRSAADWSRALTASDDAGGPVGLASWQAFARAQGVPWAVAEWGNQYGDNPLFIQSMHDLFRQHAYSGSGSAAGKLIYEVYFNQTFPNSNTTAGGEFRVQVNGADSPLRPAAAARYRALFGA